MCRPKGYDFGAFLVWKRGIHFAHFFLESGMVFEGTTGAYERSYRFNSKSIRTKWKYANSQYIWRIFCLRSNLSNDDIISAKGQVWKRAWILEVWSENGCGKWRFLGLKLGQDLENRAAHFHQEFPGLLPGTSKNQQGLQCKPEMANSI